MMMVASFDPRRDAAALAQRQARAGDEDAAFLPAIDIVEGAEATHVRAELPGVSQEQIEIEVENGVLEVRGVKQPAPAEATDRLQLSERVYGRFARRFTLPRTLDSTKIEATFRNGVLDIRIPKAETATPRKIVVA